MVVLVTGSSGQLGQSLQFIAPNYPQIEFVFCNSATLDITALNNVKQIFKQCKPNFCINAAAYTAVDKAESEPEKARLINVVGAKNVAEACKEHNTILLHISTDFVFDGNKQSPYLEEDLPNPIGVYGQTKLDGEVEIQKTSLSISQEQLKLAQTINNQIKASFELGVVSSNDLVKNETDLYQAQTNIVVAYLQLRQAELDLLKATGNIK